MKKLSQVLTLSTALLLTSCSSGWSCKARYCNAKEAKKIEHKKNA